MSERLRHAISGKLHELQGIPDSIKQAQVIVDLDVLHDTSEEAMKTWGTWMYLSVIDAPPEKRERFLHDFIRKYDSGTHIRIMTALLRHTDGFTRDDWFPDYIHYFMGEYRRFRPDQARVFFHRFWTQLADKSSMSWLPKDVKDGIIEGLNPYVYIEETLGDPVFTYQEARTAL